MSNVLQMGLITWNNRKYYERNNSIHINGGFYESLPKYVCNNVINVYGKKDQKEIKHTHTHIKRKTK